MDNVKVSYVKVIELRKDSTIISDLISDILVKYAGGIKLGSNKDAICNSICIKEDKIILEFNNRGKL